MPLLLCDLDDTLAARRGLFAAWAREFLSELGHPADELEWLVDLDADGYRHREDFFRQVLERYSLAESVQSFEQRYLRDYASRFRCEPDVLAALGRARRAGYKIAIVTNGATAYQSAKIASAGLADVVDACCISEAEGYWKPAPEIFRIAAERCDHGSDDGWMIGDNPVTDIGGATACGLRTVWLRLGRSWPEQVDYRPTAEVDTFSQAVDLILSSGAG